MIGKRKIKIGGNSYSLIFTWGAIAKFCKETGVGLSSLKDSLDNPDNLTTLIIHLAHQAGEELKREEIEKCSFFEISKALEVIGDLMEEAAGSETAPEEEGKGQGD